MTFKYDGNIPNPPADPADDVGQMQINSASISSLLAVDHVGFNVAGGGQHKQVTFNSNNVPASPTTPPILFTNTVGSLAQLFFYSGAQANSADQYYIASPGGGTGQTETSTMMLGGLILKTGIVTVTGGPTNVTFVKKFNNTCLTVVAQPINAGAPTVVNDYVYVSNASATLFQATAVRRTSAVSNTVGFYYIAIGY